LSGAGAGDPQDLRGECADPALPGAESARNILDRLPRHLHAPTRRALRQAWELDDAEKAERLLRNLARSLAREPPGVAAAILEGLDEILTVVRLGLPRELRRSLACTNIIENMLGSVRHVCRNVKRWRDASMALRLTAAAMLEAAKGFSRLKAKSQLPQLCAALLAYQRKSARAPTLAQNPRAAQRPPRARRPHFSTKVGKSPSRGKPQVCAAEMRHSCRKPSGSEGNCHRTLDQSATASGCSAEAAPELTGHGLQLP
jgi:hypothetical protein